MNVAERRIVWLTAASHALVHTYELSIPILMTVWLLEFSTTAATLGVVVTLGYGLFGVGALPGGVLVDRFGSKPLIIACMGGMAASFLLAGIAPTLWTLALAIGLWGITASVYHPAGLSLLSIAIEKPGTALGYHGIGGNLGIALGPLVTVVLLLWFDWRTVTVVLAAPAALVVAYAFSVDVAAALPDTHDGNGTKGKITLSDVGRDTRTLVTLGFGLVILIVTLNGLYYRSFLTFLPSMLGEFLSALPEIQIVDPESPYAEEFDVARWLYVAILVVGVVGQYLGGKAADRFPTERGLTVALGALAVLALVFVPASVHVGSFVAVSLLLGVTLFSIQPLSQATVAYYSPPETRGLSFGYTYLAIFGVGALGAALAGGVLTFGSANLLFVVLAGLAATGSIVSIVLFRVGTRRS